MTVPPPEDIPEHHLLKFPPFPPKERVDAMTVPFSQWKPTGGVTVPTAPSGPSTEASLNKGLDGWTKDVAKTGYDSHGMPFVDLDVDRSPEHLRAQKAERNRRYQESRRVRCTIPAADCWAIAREGTDWVEPENTSINVFEVSRPPFSRLMDSLYDFNQSRHEATHAKEYRQLFIKMRYGLGLQTGFPGLHWPGTGPDAEKYRSTHHARREATTEQLNDEKNNELGEICPLIHSTEKAVRGFLATARTQSEAVWDIAPALRLAQMFAAFMAFIEHYEVFPEPYLAPAFERATALAKRAPACLVQSKNVEDEIDRLQGLNQAAWALWCGSYGDREGVQLGTVRWPATSTNEQVKSDGEDDDDGGWGVSDDTPSKPTLTPSEAADILKPFLEPIAPSTVRQLNYLPFGRRRVVSVHPPSPSPGAPAFMATHLRLRTVPAPWTEEEQWRQKGWKVKRSEAESTAVEEAANDAGDHIPLELEQNTCPEPVELDVWVDGAALGLDADGDNAWVVGMGFRARWAEVGTDEHRWWILKLKDYVLPSFWQSTLAEREAAKNDPPAPFPVSPTRKSENKVGSVETAHSQTQTDQVAPKLQTAECDTKTSPSDV